MTEIESLRARNAALREALVHAHEPLLLLRGEIGGHSGDEESGEHFHDCALCAVEEAIAHIEHVLDADDRVAAELLPDLPLTEERDAARRELRALEWLVTEGHAVHRIGGGIGWIEVHPWSGRQDCYRWPTYYEAARELGMPEP